MAFREFRQHAGKFASNILIGTIEAVGTATELTHPEKDTDQIVDDSLNRLHAAAHSLKNVTTGTIRGGGQWLLGQIESFGGLTAIFDRKDNPDVPDGMPIMEHGEQNMAKGRAILARTWHLN